MHPACCSTQADNNKLSHYRNVGGWLYAALWVAKGMPACVRCTYVRCAQHKNMNGSQISRILFPHTINTLLIFFSSIITYTLTVADWYEVNTVTIWAYSRLEWWSVRVFIITYYEATKGGNVFAYLRVFDMNMQNNTAHRSRHEIYDDSKYIHIRDTSVVCICLCLWCLFNVHWSWWYATRRILHSLRVPHARPLESTQSYI